MVSPKSGGPRPGKAGGEDAVVARLVAAFLRASGAPPAGEVWAGDDAAVVDLPGGPLLLSTDAAVGGVHADLTLVGLADLGWKAFAATLSDIGAMGGRPRHALVTLCAPPGTDLEELASGAAAASARWSCPVVGGDVTAAAEVSVSVTATGSLDGPGPPVLRVGAHPGDRLFVTGPLGASSAGLRALRDRSGSAETQDDAVSALLDAHRRPVARIEEGVTARRAGASAMIDVSDGLAIDLHRLADASGIGFVLERVPVAPGATEEEALCGGEDYELVVAARDGPAFETAFTDAGLRVPVDIGRCVADPAVRTLRGGPLERCGYEHRLG